MEITGARLQDVTWTEGGKLLQRFYILRSIIWRRSWHRWKRKGQSLSSVIFMGIHERRMCLCMDATIQKLQKRQEFSLLSLVNYAHTSTSVIQDLECKSLRKQQPELQLSMSLSFLTFLPWRAHSVEMTWDQMQGCTSQGRILSKLVETSADLFFFMTTFRCQPTLKSLNQTCKKARSSFPQRSTLRIPNKWETFWWESLQATKSW